MSILRTLFVDQSKIKLDCEINKIVLKGKTFCTIFLSYTPFFVFLYSNT